MTLRQVWQRTEDFVRERLGVDGASLAVAFARKLWSGARDEEVRGFGAENLAAASIALWRLFRRWRVSHSQVKVFNPDAARDGWHSDHTVLMILHPDMLFITDSILLELSRRDMRVHSLQNVVLHSSRDGEDRLQAFADAADAKDAGTGAVAEAVLYAEVDRLGDEACSELADTLIAVLADVRACVTDFDAMQQRLKEVRDDLSAHPPAIRPQGRRHRRGEGAQAQVETAIEFADWLLDLNFVFLGYCEYDYVDGQVRALPDRSLGVLRMRSARQEQDRDDRQELSRELLLEPRLLTVLKSSSRARVHRSAYSDYIVYKRFDADGNVVGECGFLGLFTWQVYTNSPWSIPLLRQKCQRLIDEAGLNPHGYDGRALHRLLHTFPRDELFLCSVEELLPMMMQISFLHERRDTRVFLRRDRYGPFYTCLVFIPRELYNTQVAVRIRDRLIAATDAVDAEYLPYFSGSSLVRAQFILRVPPQSAVKVERAALEQELIGLTRDWGTELRGELMQAFGEEQGRRLAATYVQAFPTGYHDFCSPQEAVEDIVRLEELSRERDIITRLHRRGGESEHRLSLKLFRLGERLPLSDIVPTLESMGLRVIGEEPFVVSTDERLISIHDFQLEHRAALDIDEVGERFEQAFVRVWSGAADNDSYNRLILSAGLGWRQVEVLRAYARYMKQIRFSFSQQGIADALDSHPQIAAKLVRLFEVRFAPKGEPPDAATQVEREILDLLDAVQLLNDDRILRMYLDVIAATLRTNYFQSDEAGQPRPWLSFKLRPGDIANVPQPAPWREIFVSSPRGEGVHLRAGPIARGGLRFSDRQEDYRTEVLGLVKAQVVKNAVIVPTGAKGGFVVRRPSTDPETFGRQGVDCYREFINGLLDVTDNIVGGVVVPPPQVRRYDDDDPYMVVAADKGTATFSDIANKLAEERDFWLGDAFASGGSHGYDHKKMGITARGAWVSVQRHFRELGADVHEDPLTVVGIGDMGGDVFGNGMLRSRSMRLVAAFNHRHVFVDPNPDPQVSFAERERLFGLPGSSWEDYDKKCISRGGGVFSRDQKSIRVSSDMAARFGIGDKTIAPDTLIGHLLRAEVDLIWNGGIGTYVKARRERHGDVGDRANDSLRVDADELRCRVFAEGGNLGMTQLARVEFDRRGGRVNTDFIDNSAGVDCSDHEVNIKVLLNGVVAAGDLTVRQRNRLLTAMTDDVADLVLANNFYQAQILSIAEQHCQTRLQEYQRFIARMESEQGLSRALESIPSDEELSERHAAGKNLTRPDLAVLLGYSKIHLREALRASNVHQDPVIAAQLLEEFPARLRKRYPQALTRHRLAREIIATMATNDVVHHMGPTFAVHVGDFVGARLDEVVRAWFVAAEVFSIRALFREIEAIEGVPTDARYRMMLELIWLSRRSTRWFIRHRRDRLDVAALIEQFAAPVTELTMDRSALLGAAAIEHWQGIVESLMAAGVPRRLAERTAQAPNLASALPIIEAAAHSGREPREVQRTYAAVGQALGLDWLTRQLSQLPAPSQWQTMEREALIDDVATVQGTLATAVLAGATDTTEVERRVADWFGARAASVGAWQATLNQLRHATAPDFSMFFVTCRKLDDLLRLFT